MRQDDCRTDGPEQPKSLSSPASKPPRFHKYPIRPGIIFTNKGVKVDKPARTATVDGKPVANMLAVRDTMADNSLRQAYAAGIRTTFGRSASEEAARYVRV